MELLKNLSKGNAHIEAIRQQLFDVVTLPLYPPAKVAIEAEFDTAKDAEFKRPSAFGNWKHTGGECLGVLGKDFQATQPKMLLDAFEQCLIETGFDLTKLQYTQLRGGRKIRFSVPLQPVKFKNKANVGDIVARNLILQTGFDGFTATSFLIETQVLKCTNGMTALGTEAAVKFKNTKHNLGKIVIACSDISRMIQRADNFAELIKHYDKTAVSDADVDGFLKAVLGYNRKERADLGKVKTERLDQLVHAIDVEMSRNGKTAWGLLNGLTYATNHLWTDNDNRTDYLTVGAGLLTNNKAQKYLKDLVLV